MRQGFYVALATALVLVLYPSNLTGQSSSQTLKAKSGFRWIIFASKSELADASKLARDLSKLRPDIRVLKSTNGWHSIASGPLPAGTAQSILDKLIASGAAPPDSYLSEGRRFVEDMTTQAMTYEASAPSSQEIDGAVSLLSDAFRSPIEPRLRKEVRGGVMLFYNATAYKQSFTGDRTRLKYTFTEEITQEADPGLGGAFRMSASKDGEVAFKDLQHVWIHGDENEPGKRRVTLNCLDGRPCVTWSGDGRSWKSNALDLMFGDDETARNALLAIDTLMRASK